MATTSNSSGRYLVYGGGRWRELDCDDGGVSGWGRIRFVVARQGQLQVASRERVLASLRALVAGTPSAVKLGLRLPRKCIGKLHRRSETRSMSTQTRPCKHCKCCEMNSKPASGLSMPLLETDHAPSLPQKSEEQSSVVTPAAVTSPPPALAPVAQAPAPALAVAKQAPALAVEKQAPALAVDKQAPALASATQAPALVPATQAPSLLGKRRAVPLVTIERCRDIERMLEQREKSGRYVQPSVPRPASPSPPRRSRRSEVRAPGPRAQRSPRARSRSPHSRPRPAPSRSSSSTSIRRSHRAHPDPALVPDPISSTDSSTDQENFVTTNRRVATGPIVTPNTKQKLNNVPGQRPTVGSKPQVKHAQKEVGATKATSDQSNKEFNIKSNGAKKELSKEYSSLEDHAIVAWISAGGRAQLVNGNRVWRQLEPVYPALAGRPRTWHSLRNRYLRHLLPALGALALPPRQQRDLRAAAARGEIKKRNQPGARNSIYGTVECGASSRVRSRGSGPPRPQHVRTSSPSQSPSPSQSASPPPTRTRTRRSLRYSDVKREFAARHQAPSQSPSPPTRPRTRQSLRYSDVTRQFAARHQAPSQSSSPPTRPRTRQSLRYSDVTRQFAARHGTPPPSSSSPPSPRPPPPPGPPPARPAPAGPARPERPAERRLRGRRLYTPNSEL